MPTNKILCKAVLIIAFLCSFCKAVGQETEYVTGWEGDLASFDIDDRSIRCLTDGEATVYAVRPAKPGCRWTMQCNVADGSMATIDIFPLASGIGDLDAGEHFTLTRNGSSRFVTARGIDGGGDAYNITSLTGDDSRWMTIDITLSAGNEWTVAVNGGQIFDDTVLRSHCDGGEVFALRFTGMEGARVANIAITLIHQADVMLRRLMDRLKRDFLEGGGIREEMTRARLAYRRRQGLNGADFNGANGTDE